MEVRPGYKQTEAGVIPESWSTRRLSELAELTSSKRIFENDYVPFGIPFYRGKEISQLVDGSEIEDVCYITEKKYAEIKARFGAPAKGDILVTAVGTLGNVYVVDNDAPFYFKDGNLIWLRNIRTVDSNFLGIQLRNAKAAILGGAIGSSQKALTIVVLKKLQVVTPPLPEQRVITTVLSDVDCMLAKLDALIAKKRDLKQAAMQQLLTGQTRLPGFSGEWEVKRLGEISSLCRDNVVPANFPEQLFVHFSLPAFDDGMRPVVERGSEIGSNKFRIPKDVVLVSKLNPRIPRVWAPVDIPDQAVASTEFLLLVPKESVSRDFLFVFCMSPYFCEQMELAATGTTGSHQRISPSVALNIAISLPIDGDEQTAIATVLSDMDAEIATLESRRDKTRAIKQGMMQELLTGRIRLV